MSIPSDCKKFRAAVTPMSIFIFIVGMLLLCCIIVMRDGFHFDFGALAITSVFAAVFSIGWSWMVSLSFRAAFSADGVYGHSFWGFRRFVRWQDIVGARPFRFANLPWLRIHGADGQVTWLALFQVRKSDFWQEIRKFAPPDSPVLQCTR